MRFIFQYCPTRPRARATGVIFLALALMSGALLTPAGGARAEARFEGKDRQAIEEIVREYLIENPEVLIEAMRVLEQREQNAALASRREAIEKRHADIYNDPGDFVAGNPKGDVTIVEFFDYRCGYCKQSFKPLMDFVKADGNIRLILKEFPILGPASLEASKAAIAAKKQNRYLEMHRALYEHKGQLDSEAIFGIATSLGLDTAKLRKDMEDPEIAKMVSRHYDLAEALGVDGTPAFIVGGELYPGAADKERLTEIVKTARGG
ncbi:DSBA oxidoreductase [Parvibaculum lavamentivorans DS-1]|uniref:DSBA oxidoreductase n=1 Tax=Parvibaculum lavamentivorans (strain DS-1 / DSM 13023 / NCIMB 13966) TaxID=402881 RepID=A7HYA3_PARL1|nr:DsbA family protein [Parvibaculum lavamentivorans]ABS64886.1 DSBA oxidoreductase [Parvibaculum lavamentivorans DS-1]